MTRTAVSDSPLIASTVARAAVAGASSLTNCAVEVSGKTETTGGAFWGVIARRVDASNFLIGQVSWAATLSVSINKVIAGALTTVAFGQVPGVTSLPLDTYYRMRLEVFASGRALLWFYRADGPAGSPLLVADDSALATGGTLATGGFGFWDTKTTAAAATRTYDNFTAFVPTADAAVFTGQSLELRHNGIDREDAAGATWGRVSSYNGTYLRVPPSGQESRGTRVILKPCRYDPTVLPDGAIDDVSARLFVTPRYLNVPSA